MFGSQDATSRRLSVLWQRLSTSVLSLFIAMAVQPVIRAAGFVHNENFVVLAPAVPTEEAAELFAKAVLTRAEQLRKEIALEWLGEELPPSIGQVLLNVSYAAEPDSGLTWAKDQPERQMHMLFLVTAPEQLPDCLLAHELVHCILATRFPNSQRLPAWLEEGIASQYDDAQRKLARHRIAQWYVKTEQWPQLAKVLTSQQVHSADRGAYTIATTVTELLLERGDKQKLLKFGQLASKSGLEPALRQCYGIADNAELERLWRSRLVRIATPAGGNAASR